VATRTFVRQQMDALGLTAPGLRSNRWLIEAPDEPPVTPTDASAKARLSVLTSRTE
jgi:hypothetical protein